MSKSILLSVIATAAICLAASPARAESDGWEFTYMGASIGQGWADPAWSEAAFSDYATPIYLPPTDCPTLGLCDSSGESALAFKVFGGKRYNLNFGVEGFITSIGAANSFTDYDFGQLMIETDVSFLSAGVTANGYLPIPGDIFLMGKAGLHLWSASGNYTYWDNISSTTGTGDLSESGVGLVLGGGIEMMVFRMEYEYFTVGSDNADTGVGVFTVGVFIPLS